jgi:serine/threonine protein kinase
MAPEALQKKKYSKKTDVWSFGIVGMDFSSLQMIQPHTLSLSLSSP